MVDDRSRLQGSYFSSHLEHHFSSDVILSINLDKFVQDARYDRRLLGLTTITYHVLLLIPHLVLSEVQVDEMSEMRYVGKAVVLRVDARS